MLFPSFFLLLYSWKALKGQFKFVDYLVVLFFVATAGVSVGALG